jgi:hypothetical protein
VLLSIPRTQILMLVIMLSVYAKIIGETDSCYGREFFGTLPLTIESPHGLLKGGS